MFKKLTNKIRKEPFVQKLFSGKAEVFLVGGCVRDVFLEKDPKDIDLVIRNLSFDKIVDVLNGRGTVTLTDVGDKFGVIKFVSAFSGEDFDIALPRKEQLSEVGVGHTAFDVNSSPDIPIEEDLERRDFTINSIAVQIVDDGVKVIDPFNGVGDINDRLIKETNPDAFIDDPLRMMRAVQFVSRFEGFKIDDNTLGKIQDNAHLIKTITGERVKDELDKIFNKGDIKKGLFFFHNTGLRDEIFDIGFSSEFLANNIKTKGDFWFAVCGSEDFRDILKGDINTFQEVKCIEKMISNPKQIDNLVSEATLMLAECLKKNTDFINSGILNEETEFAIQRALQMFRTKEIPFTRKELDITAEELMEMGFEGIHLGNILKEIFTNIHEGFLVNTNDDIHEFIRSKAELINK